VPVLAEQKLPIMDEQSPDAPPEKQPTADTRGAENMVMAAMIVKKDEGMILKLCGACRTS
jgi:hypothetical protein